MKYLILILLCFLSMVGYSQSLAPRGNGNVTNVDSNLFVGKSFRVPVFTDTTTANTYRTLDSAGKLIYTYNTNNIWLRSVRHQWVQFGQGGGTVIVNGFDSITYNPPNQICYWNDGFSSCFRLNKFHDSVSVNYNGQMYVYWNNGTAVDSVLAITGVVADSIYFISPLHVTGNTVSQDQVSSRDSGWTAPFQKVDSVVFRGNLLYTYSDDSVRLVGSTNTGGLQNGLISVGGITLVDSTVTVLPNVVYVRNDSLLPPITIPYSWVIHAIDLGYYQSTLIYIPSGTSIEDTLQGVKDTMNAIPPVLPAGGIAITYITTYGNTITPPVPSIPTNFWKTDAPNFITSPQSVMGTQNNRSVRFIANNIEIMRADSTRKIMINDPTTILNTQATVSIKALSSNTPALQLFQSNATNQNSGLAFLIDTIVAAAFISGVNAGTYNTAIGITRTGNVGIGGAPSFPFHVIGRDINIDGGQKIVFRNLPEWYMGYNVASEQIRTSVRDDATNRFITFGATTTGGTYTPIMSVHSVKNNVGIGIVTPDSTALLDLTSTTKGFLAPRMTGIQMNAISSPANGLLVYNTTDTAYYWYKFNTWTKFGTGSGGGGSQGLQNVITQDPVLTADNTIQFNGHSLFIQGTNVYLNMSDASQEVELYGGGTNFLISNANRIGFTAGSGGTTPNLATTSLLVYHDSMTLKSPQYRFQNLAGHGSGYLAIDNNGVATWGTGGVGTVTSVSGTTNRISSSGGTTPVIDISVNYVGQSSITTLGTISSGTWQGTSIGDTYISSASTWNAKQNAISFPNTSLKYHTGYNTFGSFNDSARNAISLTTTGSSGAATYNTSTGILNIPNYAGGSALPLNYIGFGTGSGIAGSPHLTYDSLSFDLVQINGALRTDLTPADLNFSDGSNNVELWPSGLTMNDAGAVNIANLNALGLSLTSGSGSVHYEIQPGQTNTVHLQSPDFSGTQVIPISVNGIFADAAGDIPIPTPFLPVTGTGTSTGNIIGDLNNNNLTIDNTHFFLIKSSTYPSSLFTINGTTGRVVMGDNDGDINGTFIDIRDADQIITYNATLGHQFTGKLNLITVSTGTTTDSLLTSHNGEVQKIAASTFLTPTSAAATYFQKAGDSASYVWLPNKTSLTPIPASGVTMFDSSGRWSYRTSLGKTVSFSTSNITANSSVIDTFPNYSGTFVMKYNADTIYNKVIAGTTNVLTSANFVDNETPSGTINGSNVTFTLANTPITGSVHIWVGGVRQKLTTHYSISGTTITFVTAPTTGTDLIIDYRK